MYHMSTLRITEIIMFLCGRHCVTESVLKGQLEIEQVQQQRHWHAEAGCDEWGLPDQKTRAAASDMRCGT